MPDLASLRIAVDSRSVRTADRDLSRLSQTGRKTESSVSRSAKGMSSAMYDVRTAIRTVQAALAAVAAVRLVQIADQMAGLNARLSLVTGSTVELVQAQRRLFEISQSTSLSLVSTTELYARMGLATKQLGLSVQETSRLVETINQAIVVSGATAQEASGGLIQFAQGLASGRLAGDELRSVLEQMPALADAIAEGMGKTRGELRELGQEGALTAEVVLSAIADQAPQIAKRFEQIPDTASKAFQRLQNELTRTVDQINQEAGISSAIAEAIDAITIGIPAAVAAIRISGVQIADFADATATALRLARRRLDIFMAEGLEAFEGFIDPARLAIATFVDWVLRELADAARGLSEYAANIPGIGDNVAAKLNSAADSVEALAGQEAILRAEIERRKEQSQTYIAALEAEAEALARQRLANKQAANETVEAILATADASAAVDDAASSARSASTAIDSLGQSMSLTAADATKLLESLRLDALTDAERALFDYEQQLDDLQILLTEGWITDAEFSQMADRFKQRYWDRVIADGSETGQQISEIHQRIAERIEGIYFDLGRQIVADFDNAGDAIRDTFKQLLIDLALEATRQQVLIPLVAEIGGIAGVGGEQLGGIIGALGGSEADIERAVELGTEQGAAAGTQAGLQAAAPVLAAAMGNVVAFQLGSALARNVGLDPNVGGAGAVLNPALTIGTLGLANLAQLAGNALFGGDTEVRGQRLAVSGGLNGFGAATVTRIRESGGLLGGGPDYSTAIESQAEFSNALNEVLAPALAMARDGAALFGTTLDGFGVFLDRDILGLSESEIQAVFADIAGDITDELARTVVPGIDKLRQSGETLGETLRRVITNTSAAQQQFDRLGITLGDGLNPIGIAATADALIEAAGGVNEFNRAVDTLISFAPEAERSRILMHDLTAGIGDLANQLPGTRAEFYEMFQTLGPEAQGALLGSIDLIDQYYDTIAQGSEAAAEVARDYTDLQLRLLRAQGDEQGAMQLQRLRELQAAQEAGDEVAETYLRQIFAAEDLAQATAEAEAAARQLSETLERQALAAADFNVALGFTDGLDPLREALAGFGLTLEDVQAAAQGGQAGLQELFGGLGEAGRAALAPFVRDILALIPPVVADLSEPGGALAQELQDTRAADLRDQIRAIQSAHNERMRALRDELRAATEVRRTVQTLRDFARGLALQGLDSARGLDFQQREFVRALNLARGGDPGAVRNAQSVAGDLVDRLRDNSATREDFEFALRGVQNELFTLAEGLDIDEQQLRALNTQIAEAETQHSLELAALNSQIDMLTILDATGQAQIQAGISTGLQIQGSIDALGDRLEPRPAEVVVGSNGPEIFPAPAPRSDTDTLQELRQLRNDFREGIRVLQRNTGRTADILDDWDINGQPEERPAGVV